MITCVVFDFDGVLVDSNRIKRDAYFEVFGAFGDVRDLVLAGLSEEPAADRYAVIRLILAKLRASGLRSADASDARDLQSCVQRYGQICEEATIRCPEVPGASSCLRNLAGRYTLYVNSGTPTSALRTVIRARSWERFFEDVLGSPGSKAGNLGHIVRREAAEPDTVLFVGDRQHDLAAACACGCHFVGVRNPDNDFGTEDVLCVDDLHGLERLIREY
ncbi:MAG: HAD family hydrolase [Kiritimatiellae bacterium]|nr:HAD family hydrolase [Kiritimatiellia bacterium]